MIGDKIILFGVTSSSERQIINTIQVGFNTGITSSEIVMNLSRSNAVSEIRVCRLQSHKWRK